MIAVARTTPPPPSNLIGQRLTIYEMAEAGLELHSTGVLDAIERDGDETYWILRDEATGVRWPFAFSDIRQIEYHGWPETRCVA